MSALVARDLVKSYGDRTVLFGIDLAATPGHRLGLVGENGAGKSTLLRLLAGVETPDGGEIARPADLGYLPQEPAADPSATVGTVIEDALAELRAIEKRLTSLAERVAAGEQVADEYAAALDEATARDVWAADRRVEVVLAGLGLGGLDRARRIGALSGGERTRLALAGLLARRPRALLLDEPTNHLDDDAVTFLQDHLRELPGAVVVASHDRVLLDAVCTEILDLDPARGMHRYTGTFTDYRAAKRAERARWEQAYAEQQDEISQLRKAISTTARQVAHGRPMRDREKMGYGRRAGRVESSVSSRVRNARHRLAVVEEHRVPKPPTPLRFSASLGTAIGDGPVLSGRSLHVPGRLAVELLDVPAGGRLLVTGANGAGKSTLLSVLAGALRPSSGWVWRRPGARIALLEQDVRFADPTRTPRSMWGEAAPDPHQLGLLAARDLDRPIGELSTGQRRRFALARLLVDGPHALLLDEPTNHLSLALVDELEDALDTAPGAVVIASHDRWLRRRWTAPELRLTAAS